jgi:glycosyltransferase involved in cell wall biosynthesis
VAALYAASDLCLWPACNEAYGMAMLEAQAAGVPVVSVADRGVPDVVLDGGTGLLATDRSAQALADLARGLLVDPLRRAAMGRAAIEHVAGRSLQSAAQVLDVALRQVQVSARAT